MKTLLALVFLVSSLALAANLGDTPKLPESLTDSYGKSNRVESNRWRVFFFYPRAGTSGCTTQNIEYTKLYAQFLEEKAQVFGVSGDNAKAQCAFIEAQKLKVPQIPDAAGALAKAFAVGGFIGMYSRDTAVVAPSGKIVSLRRGVNPVSDASEVLKFIQTGDCKAFTSGSSQCAKP